MTFTARFVQAHTVRFMTSPANLRLTIDGGQDSAATEQGWAPGSIHTISAPATQTDLQGRRYRFVSWSNGKSAAFDYTAGAAGQAPAIVATYQLLGQATIVSSVANLSVEVDGAACTTPCKIEKDAGQSVRVVVPVSIPNGDQARTTFRGWTDSDAPARSIQLTGDAKTYTLRYAAQSRVNVAASPAEGASLTLDPASPDGFYDNGSVLAVAATPALGFRLQNWTGDLTGTGTRLALVVDAPKAAILMLDRVPAIAPQGVRSAALSSRSLDVAPGSLISIFGANLAPALDVSQTSPLPQSLQGVTVRIDDYFLPLVFVSPGQINAQVPASMDPGDHRLAVRWNGKPETSATVRIARNAPGLFASDSVTDPAGVFFRPGGSPIDSDRPARAGETISVLGTGIGAYLTAPPDGFVLDESSAWSSADRVVVVLGEAEQDPAFAGRSNAGVGIDVVRFRLPDQLPDGTHSLPVRIIVNGRDSNTVWLPIGQ